MGLVTLILQITIVTLPMLLESLEASWSSCTLKCKSEEPIAAAVQLTVVQGDSRAADICWRKDELWQFSVTLQGDEKEKISPGSFIRTLQRKGRDICCIVQGCCYCLLSSWNRTAFFLVKKLWRMSEEVKHGNPCNCGIDWVSNLELLLCKGRIRTRTANSQVWQCGRLWKLQSWGPPAVCKQSQG